MTMAINMKLKVKNWSPRYDINRPRPRPGTRHKYTALDLRTNTSLSQCNDGFMY